MFQRKSSAKLLNLSPIPPSSSVSTQIPVLTATKENATQPSNQPLQPVSDTTTPLHTTTPLLPVLTVTEENATPPLNQPLQTVSDTTTALNTTTPLLPVLSVTEEDATQASNQPLQAVSENTTPLLQALCSLSDFSGFSCDMSLSYSARELLGSSHNFSSFEWHFDASAGPFQTVSDTAAPLLPVLTATEENATQTSYQPLQTVSDTTTALNTTTPLLPVLSVTEEDATQALNQQLQAVSDSTTPLLPVLCSLSDFSGFSCDMSLSYSACELLGSSHNLNFSSFEWHLDASAGPFQTVSDTAAPLLPVLTATEENATQTLNQSLQPVSDTTTALNTTTALVPVQEGLLKGSQSVKLHSTCTKKQTRAKTQKQRGRQKKTADNRQQANTQKQRGRQKKTVDNRDQAPTVEIRDIPLKSDDSALSSDNDGDEYETVKRVNKAAHNLHPQPSTTSTGDKELKEVVKDRKSRYKWMNKKLQKDPDSIQFTGSTSMPNQSRKTPLQFFKHFFDDDIFNQIAAQTALYSTQQNPQKPAPVNADDIQQFIGICLYMSLIRITSTRSYWCSRSRIEQVADVMTANRFEELKRFLHFSDNNSATNGDKIAKIRPLLEHLRAKFKSIPMEENLSIDEQIVPFKGRSCLRQYNPRKPHKWGYKTWVLCGVSGDAYDFELYTGREDNQLADGEEDCGASGNVVVRLSRSIPPNVNHKVYFDNYFNSPDLQIYLATKGIWSVGTVRANRIPQCSLKTEQDLKKLGRGAFDEKVAVVDGIQISSI